jgi:hypothetical protein
MNIALIADRGAAFCALEILITLYPGLN